MLRALWSTLTHGASVANASSAPETPSSLRSSTKISSHEYGRERRNARNCSSAAGSCAAPLYTGTISERIGGRIAEEFWEFTRERLKSETLVRSSKYTRAGHSGAVAAASSRNLSHRRWARRVARVTRRARYHAQRRRPGRVDVGARARQRDVTARVGFREQDLRQPNATAGERVRGCRHVQPPYAVRLLAHERHGRITSMLQPSHPVPEGERVMLAQRLDIARLEAGALAAAHGCFERHELAIRKDVALDECALRPERAPREREQTARGLRPYDAVIQEQAAGLR